jgi:hypothetical protein
MFQKAVSVVSIQNSAKSEQETDNRTYILCITMFHGAMFSINGAQPLGMEADSWELADILVRN